GTGRTRRAREMADALCRLRQCVGRGRGRCPQGGERHAGAPASALAGAGRAPVARGGVHRCGPVLCGLQLSGMGGHRLSRPTCAPIARATAAGLLFGVIGRRRFDMKKFIAFYMGSADAMEKAAATSRNDPERDRRGMKAWGEWMQANEAAILDMGGPLGKTMRVSLDGFAAHRNDLTGYVILEAESHEAAARLFEN